jgi:signal transduction histidine kinase
VHDYPNAVFMESEMLHEETKKTRQGHENNEGPSMRMQLDARERRSLSRAVIAAREAERQRIATGLHDDVAQTLAVLQLRLGALSRLVTEPSAKLLVGEIEALAQRSARSVRATVFELGAAISKREPLDDAVRRLVAQLRLRMGDQMDIRMELAGPATPLAFATRTLLLRVVYEGLVNAARHSHGSRANVVTAREGRYVIVSVSDNGTGFDACPQRATEEHGFGLFSLMAQIDHLGGRLEVVSVRGLGVCLHAALPLVRAVPRASRPLSANRRGG